MNTEYAERSGPGELYGVKETDQYDPDHLDNSFGPSTQGSLPLGFPSERVQIQWLLRD